MSQYGLYETLVGCTHFGPFFLQNIMSVQHWKSYFVAPFCVEDSFINHYIMLEFAMFNLHLQLYSLQAGAKYFRVLNKINKNE